MDEDRGMSTGDSTCWTVIEGAAAGDEAARDTFATTYLDVVRAYLSARWRGTAHVERLEDAVQDVFFDCLRTRGALARADRGRSSFRPFLHGIVKNVALRHEERRGREGRERDPGAIAEDRIEATEEQLSRVFDRAWARSILARAADRQRRAAHDEASRARVRLLEARFSEGLPIREIAARWEVDATRLHREYAKAREEFKRCLHEEVAFHMPGTHASIEAECERLQALLKRD